MIRPRPAASRVVLAISLGLTLVSAGCARRSEPRRELWIYYATNLADDDAVAKLEPVWRRAAAAGYSRVLLADAKFSRLGEMDEHYFANVQRVRALASELKLEITPCVFPIGRSSPILVHDPNLAEGLPVRNALFEVRGGEARLVADPPVAFGERPDLIDAEVGLEDGIARVDGNRRRARFMYRIGVKPFRCYHVSVRVRTTGFTGRPLIQVLAGGRAIYFAKRLGVQRDQDWTTHDIAFQSLDHDEVAVYFGVWTPADGLLEWRDWRIEESGPFNVLRRPGAPFEVHGYVEGRDYERVEDPGLGMAPRPGVYDVWHPPVPIRTRLPDGTRFRASWYQAAVLYEGQVSCCLSEPALRGLLADEAARVRNTWTPRGFMMMHDEIRALNWDASCQARHTTPGRILAAHMRECVPLFGDSQVLVWSDMFDPHHNARRGDHLVNGDLSGSWEGLPGSVVIVNWNGGAEARASLRFFAQRGHRQVIAGYYDQPPGEVRRWLDAARDVPEVFAIMYTTWLDRFDDLEAFARAARGGG
jgi:hypothetical protein